MALDSPVRRVRSVLNGVAVAARAVAHHRFSLLDKVLGHASVDVDQKPSKTFMLRSGEVETVKVHDFVPHRYKVMQEQLQGVLTSVDFRQRPELRVGTED